MTAVNLQHDRSEFVSVYSGPIGVAHTLRATLESAGFFAFIPFDNMKTLAPFSTGANAFDASAHVATMDAEAVREYMTATTTADLHDKWDEEEDDYEIELGWEVRSAASHIRWGLAIQMIALPLPLPIPWIFAVRYFGVIQQPRIPPSGHPFTRAVLLLSAALFAGSLIWLYWFLLTLFNWLTLIGLSPSGLPQ